MYHRNFSRQLRMSRNYNDLALPILLTTRYFFTQFPISTMPRVKDGIDRAIIVLACGGSRRQHGLLPSTLADPESRGMSDKTACRSPASRVLVAGYAVPASV
jgi:hypothetical protein